MAVDFNQIQETAQNIRDLSNELLELVNFGVAGILNAKRLGNIPLTASQKNELKSQYQTLLDSLKTQINSL